MGKDIVENMEDILGIKEEEKKEENSVVVGKGADSKEEKKEEIDTKQEKEEEKKEEVSPESKNVTLTPEQVDINNEIAKIDVKLENLEKSEVNLDDFYATLESTLSDDEVQLEFDDKPAYLKIVDKKAKEYVKEHSNVDEIKNLSDKKSELEGIYQRQEGIKAVTQKYPAYNHEIVSDFFANKLTKEEQAKIFDGAQNYEDVYENTYKKYLEKNPVNIEKSTTPDIPDVNSVRKQSVNTNEIKDGFKDEDEQLQEALGL